MLFDVLPCCCNFYTCILTCILRHVVYIFAILIVRQDQQWLEAETRHPAHVYLFSGMPENPLCLESSKHLRKFARLGAAVMGGFHYFNINN
jgi:hypothetical protein